MSSESARRFIRRDETLLGAVLFGFLVLLSMQVVTAGGQSLFKAVVYQGVAPLLRGGDFFYRGVARLAHDYAAFRSVVKENEALRERVRALEVERLDAEFVRRDHATLAALLDYRRSASLHTLAVRVIARDLRDPWRMLVINRGRRHGVEPDMAVLSPEGVVGRVVAVSARTAQVQLLTDAQSALAVVHVPSGEQVLAAGEGTPLLKLHYLSPETPVAAGDALVTAGFEGVHFQGLRVGAVERVGEERGRRVAWARVSAPLARLTAALVVMERPPRPDAERDGPEEAPADREDSAAEENAR